MTVYKSKIFSSPIKNVSHLFKLNGIQKQKPKAYDLSSIIRVDLAGEMGANMIYVGQLAVLGNTSAANTIKEMGEQEKYHEKTFKELVIKYRVRPSLLANVWKTAGYLLGAGTSLMGVEAAMACTSSVETVIVEHYNEQLRQLIADPVENKEILEIITKFRDDEQEHHDTGITHGAELAPFYKALTAVISTGCRGAIGLAKVV